MSTSIVSVSCAICCSDWCMRDAIVPRMPRIGIVADGVCVSGNVT